MDIIPEATPYPWAPNERQAALISCRKRKGRGLEFLQEKLQKQGISHDAKSLLVSLLPELADDEEPVPPHKTALSSEVLFDELRSEPQIARSSQNDEEILALAQAGTLSLLGSILNVFEVSVGSVTAKILVRSCSLMVKPGSVPGHMDAKEMVLAAVHFLSSETSEESKIPFISVVQNHDDLEKRTYQKEGTWTLADQEVLARVNRLETIFSESPQPPLGRMKFCPNLPSGQEITLLMKGTVPGTATGKKKSTSAKRKATTSPASFPETTDDVTF